MNDQKCQCGRPVKFQMSLNWKAGETLSVCAEHAPLWIKNNPAPKEGDQSPIKAFYTLTKIYA